MKRKIASLLFASAFALAASLLAEPNELSPSPVWHLAAGERSYLNSTLTSSGYSEQGMAFNPVTGNLYVVHAPSGFVSVHIVDGATGADVGQLSTVGVEGGVRLLRKIGVSDDGVIYAGNVTGNAASDPYRLYRWADESATPELIWSGDPSNGVSGVIRNYGSNIAVRGSGASTQILVVPDFWQQVAEAHVAALFTTQDGVTFTPTFITTVPTTRFGLGTAFGPGDTFFGSRAGQPLREFDFQGNLVREFGGSVVTLNLSPIGIHPGKKILAGIRDSQLWVYNLETLSASTFNTPIGTRGFPTTNENVERTGEIAFGGDLIYALDTNNGIVAYRYGPPLPPEPVRPGDIFWTNRNAIRTADLDGTPARTVVEGVSRPIGIAIHAKDRHLYWVEDGSGRIMRADLDGMNITEIVTGRTMPQFLAIDERNDRLYWAEFTSGLYSARLDGSDVRHLIQRPSNGQSTAVVLDLENNYVYLGSAAGELFRVSLTADFPVSPASLAPLYADTYGLALPPGSGLLYATTFGGGFVYNKNLTTLTNNYIHFNLERPLGIAFNEAGDQMVWAERTFVDTQGRIRTAATGSSTFTTLFEGEDSPFGIVFTPSLPAPTGFAGWIATFDLSAANRAPEADPDGDGIPNLLEFALGLNPTIANRASLPVPEVLRVNGNDYLLLEVAKGEGAETITLVVEASSDLVEWNAGAGHTVVLEDSASVLRVRDAQPLHEAHRRFLRLRAEMH